MADLGLIFGAAAAGALQGGGAAGVVALHSAQEAEQKEDLVKMQAQLEEQKDLRIAEASHGYRMEEQGAQFAHEDTTQANQQKFLGGEGDKNRSNALSLGKLQSDTEIKAAGIHAGASLAAARISAGASMANAKLAAMGKSVMTLGDGRIVAIGIDPSTGTQKVTPMMDPADPNKPLMGVKNLDQRTILLAQSYGNEGQKAMAMGDTDGASKNFQMMRDILQGKDPGSLGSPDHKVASPKSVDYLVKNPGTAAQFDTQFGKGSAAEILNAAKAAPSTAAPAAPSAAVPAAPAAATPTAAVPAAPAAAPTAPTAPPAPPAGSPFAAPAQPALGSGMALGQQDYTGLVNGNM